MTEPGARYIDFLVPGLVGLNLMSSSMWGIGYLIVEMRTKKLIKRLLATPMRRTDFLLSFVVMRAMFVLIEVPVLFAFGWLAFGVRIADRGLLLLGVSLLGALTFAGLGLLVASRAAEHADGGRADEPRDDADVHRLGRVLRDDELPRRDAAVPAALPLTAINDALRNVANQGGGVAGHRRAAGGAGRVGRRLVRRGAADLPLALSALRSSRASAMRKNGPLSDTLPRSRPLAMRASVDARVGPRSSRSLVTQP